MKVLVKYISGHILFLSCVLSGLLCLSLTGPACAQDNRAKPEASPGSASSIRQFKPAPRPFDHTYGLLGRELAKYVEGETGLVHYRRWQKDQTGLKAFLDEMARLDKNVYEKFDQQERLAFWLNVYNALAIQSVLDHYPVKATVDYFPADSIRQFNDGWEVLTFKIMGSPITLYDIEHDRLRLGCRDPRMHFAVASASMDSARISKNPFVPHTLDQRLDNLTHQFFSQPNAYVLDTNRHTVFVSKIFSWFTLDFATMAGYGKVVSPPPKDEDIILSFISLYLPPEQRQALESARKRGDLRFDYLPYDWALNDADNRPAEKR